MREGQPHGDQTRESQPEAVKDNPPRAPTAQRLTSVSLKTGQVTRTRRCTPGNGRRARWPASPVLEIPGPAALPRTSILPHSVGGTALRRRGAEVTLRAVPRRRGPGDRIEVGIAFKQRAGPLREFDRAPKGARWPGRSGQRGFRSKRCCRTGRRTVGRPSAARVLDPPPQRNRRLVEWPQWRKQLPASRLVRLTGNTAHGDDRRVGLVSESCTFDAGAHKDERSPRARRTAHRRPRRMRARVARDTAPRCNPARTRRAH